MSTTIRIRRSAVPGRVPTTAQLELGELAINTADGKLYFKRYDPVANTESIIDMSADLDAAAILDLIKGVDGANSGLDADLLDGQDGSYYLDYNNFTNVPPATLDLTLTGKVTGTAFSNTGIMTLVTELANTGVVANTYGSSTAIPIITIDEDGRITAANTTPVAGVDDFTWDAANNQLVLTTGDGTVYNIYLNQFKDLVVEDLTANTINISSFTFDALDVGGDISANNALFTGDLEVTGNTDISHHLTANNGTVVNHLTVGSLTVLGDTSTGNQADSGTLVANTATFNWLNVVEVADIEDLQANVGTINTLDSVDITANTGTFEWLTVNNDIVVNGTVDGRDIAADGAVLDSLANSTTTVNLTGKVTGSAVSANNVVNITTELANTGVIPGTYGSASLVPILTIDEDGRITVANTTSVAGVSNTYWTSSNNTFTIETADGGVFNTEISSFNDISANNITVSGLVDGRDISADGSKLDGIEAGATADQTAADIRGLGFFDITNDGTGSGLDADLLDGLHAADILNQAANNAANQIGDGTIIVSGNTGLNGYGSFTLNQFSNNTITITHADTSSQANVAYDNSDGTVIQDLAINLDDFGHVVGITGAVLNLDTRYYTEIELDAGQLDTRYYTETELDNGQLDNRYYTETELDAGQLDNRYYTETEADSRFVNVTGDTMSGNLTVNAEIRQEYANHITATKTTVSTSQTSLYAFPYGQFTGGEFIVTAKRGVDTQITKLLVTHDGSTVLATEFGTLFTNAQLAEIDVRFQGVTIELTVTPSSATSTIYKISGTLMKV